MRGGRCVISLKLGQTLSPRLSLPLGSSGLLFEHPSSAHAVATSATQPISLSASVLAALSRCILRLSPLSVSGCNSFREGFSAPYARARIGDDIGRRHAGPIENTTLRPQSLTAPGERRLSSTFGSGSVWIAPAATLPARCPVILIKPLSSFFVCAEEQLWVCGGYHRAN